VSPRNISASVRARLLAKARAEGQDYNRILTRYALERLLYRVSVSPYADQFLLKGALLFDLWFGLVPRPTRDADLLGLGPSDLSYLEGVFRQFCNVDAPDGVTFDPDSVRVAEIREQANYPGARMTMLAYLDGAEIGVQVDIGFGDVVTPGPETATYPVLLPDVAAPVLRVYPRYTVVAEKLETIVSFGIANSRLKDYFDLHTLATSFDFDGPTLAGAVRATFERRRTPLPEGLPLGLTRAFSDDPSKQAQWSAFLNRNRLTSTSLQDVVTALVVFLLPVLEAARAESPMLCHWSPGGPWQTPVLGSSIG
jgi:hypothetical protein